MPEREFEWDEDKAAANEAKHGISFAQGAAVFGDVLRVDEADLRYPDEERRRYVIGFSEGRMLHVAYVERGVRTRLISARKATAAERMKYARQNDIV